MALALAAKHHVSLPPATPQLVGLEPGHDAAAELAQVICPSNSGLDDGRQAAAVVATLMRVPRRSVNQSLLYC